MKILTKYLLLLLALIVADQIIGTSISYLSRQQIRDNRIGLLMEGKIKSDIYIIGSSRALNNYSPKIIADSLGISCYNFGLSGSNILYHEAILDLIIESGNIPKTIIYSVDDHATFYKMENVLFRKDVLLPYVNYKPVSKIVSKELKKNYYACLLSSSYNQNINFNNALKYCIYGKEEADYKTNSLDELGSNLLIHRDIDPPASFKFRKVSLDKNKIYLPFWAAFRRIQEKCQQNNIEIIFILPPIYTSTFPGYNSVVKSAVFKNNRMFNFSTLINDSTLFYNPDHLNKRGAEIFTNHLVTHVLTEKN